MRCERCIPHHMSSCSYMHLLHLLYDFVTRLTLLHTSLQHRILTVISSLQQYPIPNPCWQRQPYYHPLHCKLNKQIEVTWQNAITTKVWKTHHPNERQTGRRVLLSKAPTVWPVVLKKPSLRDACTPTDNATGLGRRQQARGGCKLQAIRPISQLAVQLHTADTVTSTLACSPASHAAITS